MSTDDPGYIPASDDLPVYPNGYVDRYHYCNCLFGPNIGRTMINSRWVQVCISCGCVVGVPPRTH